MLTLTYSTHLFNKNNRGSMTIPYNSNYYYIDTNNNNDWPIYSIHKQQ